MRWNILEKPEESAPIVPEYGRRKLILYADTLKEIAQSFKPREEDRPLKEVSLLLYKERQEQNELLAGQLGETARVLDELAKETYETSYLMERIKKRVARGLKDNGLYVKSLYVIENEEHLEIGMCVKALSDDIYHTDDLTEYLSSLCHRKLRQDGANASYVHEDLVTLLFEEELNYYVAEGIAKAKKEGESDSGDSCMIREFGRGMLLAALSDGMGSGKEAAADSEGVMNLLDKFMETGFHLNKAISLLNSMIYLNGSRERTVTLDSCEVDLYQGTCHFLKYGAAVSFIKRGKKVWRVGTSSLPLGLFARVEPEEYAFGLEDGDYIILVSDGLLDAYEQRAGSCSLEEFIGDLDYENPRQMAQLLINMAITNAGGKMEDDMTAVVLGIWANT